jgi:hypothetical protein
MSEHLCQGEIGVAISAKEILHFGKFDLGFLDILSLFFPAKKEAAHVRLHVGGRAETGPMCEVVQPVPHVRLYRRRQQAVQHVCKLEGFFRNLLNM